MRVTTTGKQNFTAYFYVKNEELPPSIPYTKRRKQRANLDEAPPALLNDGVKSSEDNSIPEEQSPAKITHVLIA